MPANQRVRGNNAFGTVTDNPLTAGSVTMNSLGLANLPSVVTQHAVITLDPLREFGEPEIIVVTAHTASATVATIIRGQYGTVARSHPSGTTWVHAPVDEDYIEILTSSTRPTDPYRGQMIFETDTNKFVARSTDDIWQDAVPLGAWTTYTPTDTSVTVGNGTRLARYSRIGRIIHFFWALTFGNTSAFTGAVAVGLPVMPAANGFWIVSVHLLDSGSQNYTAGAIINPSTQTAIPHLGITTGTAITGGGGLTGTIPFTWAVNDRLVVSGTYEAVS